MIPLASPLWVQDGSSYPRHHTLSGQEARGSEETAAAAPLPQGSRTFPTLPPPPLACPQLPPLQLNCTRILPAGLDHAVTPTHKGCWDSEQLVLRVSIVQAGKGVGFGREYRATVSGRVVFNQLSFSSYFYFYFYVMPNSPGF